MTTMEYTLFNQHGKAMSMSDSIAYLINNAATGGCRYYFITNDNNEVLVNEMKGRSLPKRTSHGSVTSK